jgi:hypothetical protein
MRRWLLQEGPKRFAATRVSPEVFMCQRITCSKCGRPSFTGCGMHVESVLKDVPRDQRCACREASTTPAPGPRGGFLDKLLRR